MGTPRRTPRVASFFAGFPLWGAIVSALLVFTTLLVVSWPRKTEPLHAIDEVPSEILDPQTDSILIVTVGEHRASITDAEHIKSAWWSGTVVHLNRATIDDFMRELRRGPSVIHIEASIGPDWVMFEDGKILAKQLQELFRTNNKKAKLVVLADCQSFSIGRALDHSDIHALLVATSNLPTQLAHHFYLRFYRKLAEKVSIKGAFEQTQADLDARTGGAVAETFSLTQYERH